MKRLFVVALLLVACKRTVNAPPGPPQIVDVKVVDRSAAEDKQPLDLAALTAAAEDAIKKASGLQVVDAGTTTGRRYRLRVELRTEGVEDPPSGKGILRALVTARLTPVPEGDGLPFEQSAVAERQYEIAKKGDPVAAWRAHALRAVTDVVGGVGARVKLSTGDVRALTAALDGADEDLRAEAARLCGEAHERACVPSLVKQLKSEDHDLRDRAIGALAAIGDARAVRPLTEVARFRDLSDLPKILDALALIGGDEARAYLEFVASGHDSPEIRDLAKQSLGHLERRHRDLGALQP